MADFATIYLPGDIPTLEWLSEYPYVTESKFTDAEKRQIKLKFFDMNLTVNVMSDSELKPHLTGFANYIMSLHLKKQADATHSVLERIAATRNVLGCVIEPRLDKDGFMGGFLTAIAQHVNGLMFAQDSVFDSDGTSLLVPDQVQ